jgi:hypothetical protein
MSTYQMVVRSTANVFNGVDFAAMYERFLDWWVSLYIEDRRPPRWYL